MGKNSRNSSGRSRVSGRVSKAYLKYNDKQARQHATRQQSLYLKSLEAPVDSNKGSTTTAEDFHYPHRSSAFTPTGSTLVALHPSSTNNRGRRFSVAWLLISTLLLVHGAQASDSFVECMLTENEVGSFNAFGEKNSQVVNRQKATSYLKETISALAPHNKCLGNNHPQLSLDVTKAGEVVPRSCLRGPASAPCQIEKMIMSTHANLQYLYPTQQANPQSAKLNIQLVEKRAADKVRMKELSQQFSRAFQGSSLNPRSKAMLDFGRFLPRLGTAWDNKALACAEMASISYLRMLLIQKTYGVNFPIHFVEVEYRSLQRNYDHAFLLVNATKLDDDLAPYKFSKSTLGSAAVVDPYMGEDFVMAPVAESTKLLRIHKARYASDAKSKRLPSYQELAAARRQALGTNLFSFFGECLRKAEEIATTNVVDLCA